MKHKPIEVGDVFVRLTVISFAGYNNRKVKLWRCVCSCGENVVCNDADLKRGHSQSCGCLISEKTSLRNKQGRKTNEVISTNEFITTLKALNTNSLFIIDTRDIPIISEFGWGESNRGYIVSGRGGKIHQLIIKHYNPEYEYHPRDSVIDHINRNKLDNRLENLRVCSQKENVKNKGENHSFR